MEFKDTTKGFVAHGVRFSSNRGNQAVGECPFCHKEDHFYVNVENRLWDCKRCGTRGNFQAFLEAVCKQNEKGFTDELLTRLAIDRKLPKSAFVGQGIGFNGTDFTFPVCGLSGNLEDLRFYRPGQKTRSTAGASLGLIYGRELRTFEGDEVYICEGEWDTLAFSWLVRKLEKKVCTVGVTGAAVFKKEWIGAFSGKKVFLLHDNDAAGENGRKLCRERLEGTAAEIHEVVWPESLPPGFDVRDLIVQEAVKGGKPRKAWAELQKLLNVPLAPVQATIHAKKRPSAGEVAEAYRKWLHFTDDEVLRILFGAVIANKMQGDPLWIFMIAPPGGSKSELLMSLSRHPMVESTTSLTPHTLVSGANFLNGVDPSLLPRLNNRILVIKDFTTILTMHYSSRDEIFGVLRDCYDGKTEKTFGTGVKRSYTSHFGILAGVTPKIEEFGIMHQSLGERFLKYRIQTGEKTLSEADRIRRALKNINKEVQMREELCIIGSRAMDIPLPSVLPELPEDIFEYIVNLAQGCAMMRGVVERDRFSQQVIYKPAIEVGTRIAKQLAKLAIGIAVYLEKKTVDLEVYNLVKRVALDTAPDRVEEIVRQIWTGCETENDALRTADVSARTRLPAATCFRVLQDLELLRLVNRVGAGNKYEWQINKKLGQLIDEGKIYSRNGS